MTRAAKWGTRAACMAWAAAIVALLFTATSALAQESTPQVSPRATVTLVSDAATVAPGQTFRVGLRQKLAPRWHTYWKNPGDAGSPPDIRLTLPDGATSGEIVWPGPSRFAAGPAMSYGYASEIVFPIAVTIPQGASPGQTFAVAADADWVVCEKECIPESGRFRLELPIGAASLPAGGGVGCGVATMCVPHSLSRMRGAASRRHGPRG